MELRGMSMWPIRESQLATVLIGSVGLVLFLALTVSAYRHGTSGRRFMPGLLLIVFVAFNTLLRGLFFPHQPPTGSAGLWRLANALLALTGGIMCERELRKQRNQKRPN